MLSEVDLFRALADEDRLRIVRLLSEQPDGACVCELVDALRLPQYEVSRQLAVLRGAGLVEGNKQGVWVYYRVAALTRLARTIVEELSQTLTKGSWAADLTRFQERLKWRSRGLCVIGYESSVPFRQTIEGTEITVQRARPR